MLTSYFPFVGYLETLILRHSDNLSKSLQLDTTEGNLTLDVLQFTYHENKFKNANSLLAKHVLLDVYRLDELMETYT